MMSKQNVISDPTTPMQTLDATELAVLRENKNVLLVDVREPVEHAGERIPGSRLAPLSRFDPQQFAGSEADAIVLYCRTGTRSRSAAQKMTAAGVPALELSGGITAWKAAGLPTEADASAPISLERQVRIVAGGMVFAGSLLAAFVSPWWLLLTGFVGAGLAFAGVTNTCTMALLLARLPYNQRVNSSAEPATR